MNEALREASKGAQAGILAVVDEPLVSVDFRCTDVSTSIDSSLTMVMGAALILGHFATPESPNVTCFAVVARRCCARDLLQILGSIMQASPWQV